ncbi:Tubulin/FtsZ family, GTPase domain-containing protein [Chytriomyces cf. hyalinus JEL632]|nr:Tubulin/FtsZ family, GTPase domain-containing protein [Chytriomyces cf. hyalinus JEL632]
MPECIVVPVGQCGNQIAARFWDLALQEQSLTHSPSTSNSNSKLADAALNTFFTTSNKRHLKGLRARALMIDMEEGVINQVMQSPVRTLFEGSQIISSNSGSGNNWAVGYSIYGQEFESQISESLRQQAEQCDNLQSFFQITSLGGGTGSGLGSKVGELLADEYPRVYRFATAVCPSANDDVVTSPYNTILSLWKLIQNADCVLPVENQALIDICEKVALGTKKYHGHGMDDGDGFSRASRGNPSVIDSGKKPYGGLCSVSGAVRKKLPFDEMNNIVANLIINTTSSMRFEGTMNVDINDIVTNLVPFPNRKFLISSMTPLFSPADVNIPSRRLDQMFTDAFSKDCQLIKADPKSSTYLACALMVRGDVNVSDIRRNVDRARSWLKFVNWNQDGWKTGLCSVPPIGQTHSLLTLANNACIHESLGKMRTRFMKLYKRKANLHHYLNYMEKEDFQSALESVQSLIKEYQTS